MYSPEIERFLKIIRQCKDDYTYHYGNVNTRDKETQDLLHQIELGKYKERDKAATKLAKVRKDRRVSKDIAENTELIVAFMKNNSRLMHDLEELLGKVRRVEKTHENRMYRPKIREDLTI